MKTGSLNRLITIQTLGISESSGDVSETWSAGEEVRAKLTQIDGSRYLNPSELVDKEIYQIQLWDNNYDSNIRIVIAHYLTNDTGARITNDAGERLDPVGSKILYPIRPVMRNPDKSFRGIVTILAATKV